jgi:hypothetical protein
VDGHDGVAGRRRQPHQTLAVGKEDLVHGILVEANRRLQCEFVGARIGQVEGTRVRVEALGYEFDDIAQGLT